MSDNEEFLREMADAVRLVPDPRGRVRAAPPAVTPLASNKLPARVRREGPDGLDPGETEAGFAVDGVDRRELRKLKRGDYVPGDRLDLHGMTAVQALADMTRFIDAARSRHRCVAIVHGRGLHSAGNVAVLKAAVRESLRQHGAVLAYADAPRDDGGPGAVYVLLRR